MDWILESQREFGPDRGRQAGSDQRTTLSLRSWRRASALSPDQAQEQCTIWRQHQRVRGRLCRSGSAASPPNTSSGSVVTAGGRLLRAGRHATQGRRRLRPWPALAWLRGQPRHQITYARCLALKAHAHRSGSFAAAGFPAPPASAAGAICRIAGRSRLAQQRAVGPYRRPPVGGNQNIDSRGRQGALL